MKLRPTKMVRRLVSCQEGGIAVAAGLVLTALVVGGGIAVDYGSMVSKRSTLQAVADAASIAVAREMTLANVGQTELEAVAENMVELKQEAANGNFSVSVSVNQSAASVQVSVSENWQPYFAHLLSNAVTPITASATAKVVGAEKICVLALEETSAGAVSMIKKSILQATACGIYSNSTDPSGIALEDTALLDTRLACSAGGATGTSLNYTIAPTTDCPPVPDPLADREPPTFGNGCDETDLLIEDEVRTLSPGVYCGGLAIRKKSIVTLEPGVYIIKDGELLVDTNAKMQGVNVGFYLTGDTSTFKFWSNGVVELTAPKDGPLAGILFFEDRDAPLLRTHQIKSDEARLLLGTFYLPNGILRVDASQKVADSSAYTALVVRRLELDIQPVLVLNTDYSLTDVPVPSALSGAGGRIVLAE